MTRLRFVSRLNPSKTEAGDLAGYGNVTFAPMDALADGLGGLDNSLERPADELADGSYSYFAEGDLLLAKVTPCFENGKKALVSGLPNRIGFATSEVHVIRPNRLKIDPNYLRYLLSSVTFRAAGIASMTGAGGLRRISDNAIKDFALPVLNLDTQKAIAAYLDRETSRIDQLIAKKERQVDLLNEEVVSKTAMAVESALCSVNAPAVALRRFIVSMCDGPFGSSLKSEHYSDQGIRVIRLQNLGVGRFLDKDFAFISDAYYEGLGDHDVRPGDLLVAGLGDPKNPAGRACVAPDNLGPAMVKADCFRVRLDERALLHHFLAYYLSSPRGIDLIGREAKGVTRDRINLSILASIRVPLLPIELQRDIVRKAEAADQVTRRASQTILRSITLLTEHRAALITAAVTGRLDIEEKLPAFTTKPDRTAWRVIVGAEIIHRLPDTPKRGRVKVHKLTYLAEAHLGIDGLQGIYLREAAGPLDRALREETERGLEAAGYYRAKQTDGTGTAVTYSPLAKAGQHKAELDALLGTKADELRKFIAPFADLDRRQTEAVATLYAVWNDALMDDQTPNDAAIVNGVLNDWHTEKGEKFKAGDLSYWLAWMKRHNLIPRGQGPRTTIGRLFV